MTFGTRLAAFAMLTPLALGLPAAALAQVAPPPSAHALGIAQSATERLWCAELFLEVAEVLVSLANDPDGAAATEAKAERVLRDGQNQLLLTGVGTDRIDALREAYRRELGDPRHFNEEGFLAAFGACDDALAANDFRASPFPAGTLEDGIAAARNRDFGAAARIWYPLALSGDAEARFHLGGLYTANWLLGEDYAEAARWLMAAAEEGHFQARHAVGVLYRDGLGVAQDEAEAIRWFALAVDHAELPEHIRCAAHYFALSQLDPEREAEAGPRVSHARRAHQAEHIEASVEDVRGLAEPLAWARIHLIEAGERSLEALLADIHACDGLYGFEPVAP